MTDPADLCFDPFRKGTLDGGLYQIDPRHDRYSSSYRARSLINVVHATV